MYNICVGVPPNKILCKYRTFYQYTQINFNFVPPAATDTAGWMGDAGDFGATAGGVQGIEIFLHFLAIKFAFLSLTY